MYVFKNKLHYLLTTGHGTSGLLTMTKTAFTGMLRLQLMVEVVMVIVISHSSVVSCHS